MNEILERSLTSYLAHDLETRKKGVEEKSHLFDCLCGELYGSINIAETSGNLETSGRHIAAKFKVDSKVTSLQGQSRIGESTFDAVCDNRFRLILQGVSLCQEGKEGRS